MAQPSGQPLLASSFHPTLTAATKSPKLQNNPCPLNSPEKSGAEKWSIPCNAMGSSSLKLSDSVDDLISTENACDMKAFEHALSEIGEDPLESLNLIDAAQRLGIDYRFQTEIDAVLKRHYAISINDFGDPKSDLHEVALRFRLLRQQGYLVPADVFKIFMDKEGHFNQGLKRDIEGLMSLYEASQLCLPGEVILEEAGKFSSQILQTYVTSIDSNQAGHIANTLANPYHTSSSKFMVKNYFGIGDFHPTNKWINALQQVAKMDFNMVQSMYHQEMVQFSQWWTEHGLAKELHFARHQPLKWYICSLVCLTDPCFSNERVDLSKPISFVYLIDDIFDLYGSLDQLTLFTEAVRRWDLATAETLPDCMKICLQSLYDMTNDISSKVHQKHGWNPIDSLQKSWAKLCDAFLLEATWFASKNSTSAEEYLRNGIVSTGVHVILVHVFFLLGQGISKETMQLLDRNPDIISSTALILRLQDDLGSAEDENQHGFDGSYMKYYMMENQPISFESTRQHITDLISYAWKKLNRECLSPNPFPFAFAKASLNIARFVPLLYGYDGNQNLPSLERLVKSLLYESVEM